MKRKIVRIIVAAVAIAVMLFAAYRIISILAEYHEASETYESIAEEFRRPVTKAPETSAPATEPPATEPPVTQPPATDPPATEPPVTDPPATDPPATEPPVTEPSLKRPDEGDLPFLIDFDALKKQNKDVVGWIYSEGTPIDYPILQAKNNDYYLRRMLNKKYNVSGSIFMDYRCASDFSGLMSVVYGHNMKNDTMFGTLTKYAKQKYYDKHPSLWLLTPKQNYRIDVVAAFDVPKTSLIFFYPETEEELWGWLEELKLHPSGFTPKVTLGEGDRIIMLSTCSYAFDDARYVLVGKLVPVD